MQLKLLTDVNAKSIKVTICGGCINILTIHKVLSFKIHRVLKTFTTQDNVHHILNELTEIKS